MWWLLGTMCLIRVFGKISCLSAINMNPESHMNVSEIIIYWGYPSEEYEVVTKDGYILPINRIPHGKNNANSSAPKIVVFCQHGLFSTAGVWVSNPPDNSLAFILADAGYDVWMGNSRGNTWAKKHLYLDPNSKEFWAFSYDEMIKYDLPATINFILKKTAQKQIYYVGHSQGTLIGGLELIQRGLVKIEMTEFIKSICDLLALGAFATNQQLAEKIKTCFLLAPVATVAHIKGTGRLPSYFTPTAFKLLFGEKEFLPTAAFSKLSGYICNVMVINTACAALLGSLGGYSPGQLNKSRIDVYITHSLAGTSVQTLLHYAQDCNLVTIDQAVHTIETENVLGLIRANVSLLYNEAINKGVFQAYDWESPALNMLHYNQTTPPLYNVEAMNVQTALWSGGNDFLADLKDVANLKPKISNLIYDKIIPEFSHLDFIVGISANHEVSEEILKLIDESK